MPSSKLATALQFNKTTTPSFWTTTMLPGHLPNKLLDPGSQDDQLHFQLTWNLAGGRKKVITGIGWPDETY